MGKETCFNSQSALPGCLGELPAYDEYLVSYRNREAVITGEDEKKAVSNNGIFRHF
jgi:hypothetical protein